MGLFGLDGEGIVQRIRAVARERAATFGLGAEAGDAELRMAADRVLDDLTRDRKLRRFFRDPRSRDIADSLVKWEVVLHAVGKDRAEARYASLRGLPAPVANAERQGPDTPEPSGSPSPTPPADTPRRVMRRPRRLPEPRLPERLSDLLGAVTAEATPESDPRRPLGYDHAIWLEEWLELAVGEEAFDALEAAVAAHDGVMRVLQEDREQLFVAAPSLHPHDVRAIVIGVLARDFDPDWAERA